MAIKQKGLQQYLEDDPSLAEKISYDEFQNRINAHCSNSNMDDGVAEAFESFKLVSEEFNQGEGD